MKKEAFYNSPDKLVYQINPKCLFGSVVEKRLKKPIADHIASIKIKLSDLTLKSISLLYSMDCS